jgi:hypothetical protein
MGILFYPQDFSGPWVLTCKIQFTAYFTQRIYEDPDFLPTGYTCTRILYLQVHGHFTRGIYQDSGYFTYRINQDPGYFTCRYTRTRYILQAGYTRTLGILPTGYIL